MATFLDSFNEVVNDLNEMSHKVAVYRDDWSSLPSGVKTALKDAAKNLIDTQITKLAAVKSDIDAL